jgi:hypothetical protein
MKTTRSFLFLPDTGGWLNYRDAEIDTLRMKAGTYAVTVKARNVKIRFTRARRR